jgi:hypothetical protein
MKLRSRHEGTCRGKDSPGEHDARDPTTRSNPLQDQVARNLENEISEEEYAGPETIGERAEAQTLVHSQRCDSDICAIDVGDAVCNNDKRKDAPSYLLDRGRFECRLCSHR